MIESSLSSAGGGHLPPLSAPPSIEEVRKDNNKIMEIQLRTKSAAGDAQNQDITDGRMTINTRGEHQPFKTMMSSVVDKVPLVECNGDLIALVASQFSLVLEFRQVNLPFFASDQTSIIHFICPEWRAKIKGFVPASTN